MKRENKNSIIITSLIIAIVAMSVGYAALASQLTINGTAGTGGATWSIEFANIVKNDSLSTAGVKENNDPTVTGTSATFDVSLDYPGAKIVYDVTVKNGGTIDAVYVSADGVDAANDSEPKQIQYTVEKTDGSLDILSGENDTYRITIEWLASSNEVPTGVTTKTATIHLNYEQKV